MAGGKADVERVVAKYMTVGLPVVLDPRTVEYQRVRAVTVTEKM